MSPTRARVRVSLLLAAAAVVAVACGGPGVSGTSGPAVAALVPDHGPIGATVTIQGDGFGASQGSSTVSIGGATATVISWSATTIQFTVPDLATMSQPVTVTVGSSTTAPVNFLVQLPGRVYVLDDLRPNGVHAFSIATDGSLSEIAGSPWTMNSAASGNYAGQSQELRVDSATTQLYAVNDTSIGIFTIDRRDGTLTAAAGSPYAVCASHGLFSVAVAPGGTHVFTANAHTHDVYSLIAGAGTLTPAPGAPVHLASGSGGTAVEVTPDGQFLYVASTGTAFDGFSVAGDGSLTALPGSPFPKGNGAKGGVFRLSPDGKFLLFGDAQIVVNQLDASGIPTYVGEAGVNLDVGALAFSRDGGNVYSVHLVDEVLSWFSMTPAGVLGQGGGPVTLPNYGLAGAAETDAFDHLFTVQDGRFSAFILAVNGAPLPLTTSMAPGAPSAIVATP